MHAGGLAAALRISAHGGPALLAACGFAGAPLDRTTTFESPGKAEGSGKTREMTARRRFDISATVLAMDTLRVAVTGTCLNKSWRDEREVYPCPRTPVTRLLSPNAKARTPGRLHRIRSLCSFLGVPSRRCRELSELCKGLILPPHRGCQFAPEPPSSFAGRRSSIGGGRAQILPHVGGEAQAHLFFLIDDLIRAGTAQALCADVIAGPGHDPRIR